MVIHAFLLQEQFYVNNEAQICPKIKESVRTTRVGTLKNKRCLDFFPNKILKLTKCNRDAKNVEQYIWKQLILRQNCTESKVYFAEITTT